MFDPFIHKFVFPLSLKESNKSPSTKVHFSLKFLQNHDVNVISSKKVMWSNST